MIWLYAISDLSVTLTETLALFVLTVCFCKNPRFHPAVSRALVPLVYMAAVCTLTFFTDFGAVKIFILQGLIPLLINLCYKTGTRKSIVVMELAGLAIMLPETMATLLMYLLCQGEITTTVDGITVARWPVYVISIVLRFAFTAVAYFLLRSFTYSLQRKDIAVLTVIYLFPFCSWFASMYEYLNLQTEYTLVLDVITAALCVSFILQFLYARNVSCLREQKQRDRMQIERLRQQFSYYQKKQRDEERVRSLYHDMKNHLLILRQQEPSPRTEQMIQSLLQEAAVYEDYVHTGNEILDIILKEKAGLARDKQIDFSVAVSLSGITFIDPLDISTIFGNAIDNAIEASERLPLHKRAILLKAGRIHNFLSVLVENNCSREPPLRQSNAPAEDDFFHGFGLSNMTDAAEKYGGQLVTRNENGKFTLKILIPIP